MAKTQPLFFPEPLVAENAIILENDFAFEHVRCCHGKDGQLYVLSKLEYNYFRYDRNDQRPSFATYVVNVYDPEFRSLVVTDFTQLHRELAGPDNWDYFDPWLSVTAENLVVLSTKANRTFLYDPLLERQLGTFAACGQAQEMYDRNFAFQAEPTRTGASYAW